VRTYQLLAVVTFLISFLLGGCTGDIEEFAVSDEYLSTEDSTALKNELKSDEHVERAVAVFFDDKLIVAVQLNPWIKWKRARIEEKLQKKYSEKYPHYDVLVSADYKIYLESIKLYKDKTGRNPEKLEELKALAREET